MENNKRITHEGILNLGDFKIPCYILEDGTRILSTAAMQKALLITTPESSHRTGSMIDKFLSGSKSLKQFIEDGNYAREIQTVPCFFGKKRISGFEAQSLVDFCELMLTARDNIELTKKQLEVAKKSEILIRSLAKVGIIALIDEATGYQYEREKRELQKILSAYISEEILKWQLTFTDEFYKQIFRLWNIPFTPQFIKRKPSFIGKLTTKYIYEQLPKGVLEKIKENTPKSTAGNYRYRFHQSLTQEIGREHLKKQIIEVTTIMSISQSKEQFDSLFQQKYNSKPVQLELEFNENIEEIKLSGFNKKLKTALSHNPKDNE
jgi:hypothetical protein